VFQIAEVDTKVRAIGRQVREVQRRVSEIDRKVGQFEPKADQVDQKMNQLTHFNSVFGQLWSEFSVLCIQIYFGDSRAM
jgi:hypothetical protein